MRLTFSVSCVLPNSTSFTRSITKSKLPLGYSVLEKGASSAALNEGSEGLFGEGLWLREDKSSERSAPSLFESSSFFESGSLLGRSSGSNARCNCVARAQF